MNFEEMIQKTINTEAKTGLRYSIMVRDLDIYYTKDHYLSNSIVLSIQIQKTTAKEPCPKKSRPKKAKSAKNEAPTLSQTNMAKFSKQSKKDKKDKKRRSREHKRDHTGEQKEQILVFGTNVTNAWLKKKYPDIMC